MNRIDFLQALDHYTTPYLEEALYIPRFKSLLTNFTKCYHRSLLSGHITASAWIVNEARTSALLIHHKKLDRWLQPGGHADGDENISSVSAKEAKEETGLKLLRANSDLIFDLDIHLIPKHNGINAHFHYDVRFLYIADRKENYSMNHESNQIAWIPLDSIGALVADNQSIQRMVTKTKSIFK
jgi:8-oxo-dGTP pyrophosphatase MutT (NUDIX family)